MDNGRIFFTAGVSTYMSTFPPEDVLTSFFLDAICFQCDYFSHFLRQSDMSFLDSDCSCHIDCQIIEVRQCDNAVQYVVSSCILNGKPKEGIHKGYPLVGRLTKGVGLCSTTLIIFYKEQFS